MQDRERLPGGPHVAEVADQTPGLLGGGLEQGVAKVRHGTKTEVADGPHREVPGSLADSDLHGAHPVPTSGRNTILALDANPTKLGRSAAADPNEVEAGDVEQHGKDRSRERGGLEAGEAGADGTKANEGSDEIEPCGPLIHLVLHPEGHDAELHDQQTAENEKDGAQPHHLTLGRAPTPE